MIFQIDLWFSRYQPLFWLCGTFCCCVLG